MRATRASFQADCDEIPREKIQRFQKKVLLFYQRNRRELPWRQTRDPYKILLSEVMLQQTQVNRVLLFYKKWLTRWPTIEALATASRAEVLEAWMGLGYNTRAVNLHKAAQKIVSEYNSDVLQAMKDYDHMLGIGKYTSYAVQIFSTNANEVAVDTNIRRILIHEFKLSQKISDTALRDLAEKCLPRGKSREWHNALMDYGALYLTSQKTGIKPKTQQSKFEGSDRQIRARIVRCLLKQKMVLSELARTLTIDQKRLQRILEKMIIEKIVRQENHFYKLYE